MHVRLYCRHHDHLPAPNTSIAVPHGAHPCRCAQDGGNGDARSAATDFLQIESIVLNLDASLRVHARAHFFSWTQGLLQSLIRHELLICTLCHGKPPAFRADGFSMTTPDPATLQRHLPARYRGGAGAAQGMGRAPLPAGGDRRSAPRSRSAAARSRASSSASARRSSWCTACTTPRAARSASSPSPAVPAAPATRQAYLAQLLAPALHAAWVRTQLAAPRRRRRRADKAAGGRACSRCASSTS